MAAATAAGRPPGGRHPGLFRRHALRPSAGSQAGHGQRFLPFQLARRTLRLAWTRRIRIRHVRLICDRLIFPPAQLELFADEQKKTQQNDNLIVAIDGDSLSASLEHYFERSVQVPSHLALVANGELAGGILLERGAAAGPERRPGGPLAAAAAGQGPPGSR